MTTIAWDGKKLVGDTQTQCGNLRDLTPVLKITEMDDHYIAVCGNLFVVQKYINGTMTRKDLKESQLLRVFKTGTAEVTDGTGHWFAVEAPFAMGTGGEVALGALLAGASATKAVEIAIKVDTSSGGPLQVIKVL